MALPTELQPMFDHMQRLWLVKELYRFYIDCSDNELYEHNINRSSLLSVARTIDKDDGTGDNSQLVWNTAAQILNKIASGKLK